MLVSLQFIRKNIWLVELCLDILWDFVLLNYYLCLFFALKEKKSCKHQRTFWLAIFNFYIFTYLINDGKLHNELETFGFIYQKRVALSVLLHTSAKNTLKIGARYLYLAFKQGGSNLWVNPLRPDPTKWWFGCVWPFSGIRTSRVKISNLFKL